MPETMLKKLEPPESTKRADDCVYRAKGNLCCNSLNYLRPLRCKKYCVVKVDGWIRETFPELPEEQTKRHVIWISG